MDARVEPLSDAERAWVGEQLAAAARFGQSHGPPGGAAGLDALDHAWAAWLERQAAQPEDPNPVINAVGVAFGQALIDALDGFGWVIATDAIGTDLAVFGLPGAGDVLVYPANLVAKRYESRTSWFLVQTWQAIVRQVKETWGGTTR